MAKDILADLGLEAPPDLYKNAINLNRYSNRVAKQIAVRYNQIIKDAVTELQNPDTMQGRQRRLRLIMGSLKKSLDTWVTETSKTMKTEITGLAESQIEFSMIQMLDSIRADIKDDLKEVVVSPDFAESIVSTDPTRLNQIMLSDDLEQRVAGDRRKTYWLGRKDGAMLTLPDGQPLEKSFRGLATKSAEKFRHAVQNGMLTGTPVDQIAKGLIGAQFSREGSIRQIAATGGKDLTALANHQILTLVRTSVNQVANVASQKTYMAAGEDITDNFRFIATLDSRTSLTCATKDGKIYSYDKGPVPPLHFNCRSTTVAVPNWKALKEKYGIEPPDDEVVRATVDGPVSAKTQYGEWLYNQRSVDAKGKYLGPGLEQIDALGIQKANYFNQLVARRTGQLTKNGKYKPETAMRMAANDSIVKLVRTDGSEKTLEEIRQAYKLKEKAVEELIKAVVVPAVPTQASAERIAKRLKDEELPTMGGLQGMAAENRIQSKDVARAFDLLETDMDEASEGAKKLGQFVRQRQIFASWQTSGRQSMQHLIGNKQLEKSMVLGLARGTKGVSKANKLRTQMGLTRVKNILKEIKQGKPGSTMKGSLGMTGSTSGVQGFTIQGSNQIVMRAHSYDRPLTSKGLLEVRKAVRDSIVASHKGKPFGHVTEDLWRLTKNEKSIEAPLNWISTFIHELGHQVHFAAGRTKLTWDGARVLKDSLDTEILAGTWIPSKYGQKNMMEQFAETFVQYIFDPVALKDAAPEAYKWVDDAMNAALKAPI